MRSSAARLRSRGVPSNTTRQPGEADDAIRIRASQLDLERD
jgi:hypothetical protein